jgi:hypothetical protein
VSSSKPSISIISVIAASSTTTSDVKPSAIRMSETSSSTSSFSMNRARRVLPLVLLLRSSTLIRFSSHPVSSEAGARSGPAGRSRSRVLFVDDDVHAVLLLVDNDR